MPSHAANGFLFDGTGALLVTTGTTMALADGEYIANGLVFEADGSLSVITYASDDADTYYEQNGFLLDADGRLVVTETS